MKFPLALALLFVFFGCAENEAAKQTPAASVPQDTPRVTQQAANPYAPIDLSPMDISYFPEDYPILKMSGKTDGPPAARVIYSRPHRQGRQIFGSLLKWGEPWRLGANEATEIEFFQPAQIQGKTIATGRYTLYCIPQPTHWTVVLNSNSFIWGLKQDSTKDVQRFDVPVQKTPAPVEFFTIVFQKNGAGADLILSWDELVARLPIQLK